MRAITLILISAMPLCTMAQNTDGDQLFGSTEVHEIRLTSASTTFYTDLTTAYTNDVYTECSMTIDGVTYDQVGLKLKGNSSYNNPSVKKSMKIDMNEYVSGQSHDGLKKFNLNNGFKDPTMMREKIALDFLNANNIPAPRCTYANVYLNNTLWGIYTLVEEVNKGFLDDRFGDDNGNLYKGDPTGDLRWYGSTATSYTNHYEKQTNETENDWTDLIDLVDGINNTTDPEFNTSMNALWDLQTVYGSWVVNSLFVNLDSYLGSGHNYYIYHDSSDLKWHYITWDVNEAFANFNMGLTASALQQQSMFWLSTPGTNRPLYNRILADADLRQQYVNAYCSLLEQFSNAIIDPKIDSLRTVLDAHIQADPNKFYPYTEFINNIDNDVIGTGPGGGTIQGLKPFIAARRSFLVNEIAQEECTTALAEVAHTTSVEMYPNPTSGSFAIQASEPFSTIELIDRHGRILYTQQMQPTTKFSVEVARLATGLYVVRADGVATGLISVIK